MASPFSNAYSAVGKPYRLDFQLSNFLGSSLENSAVARLSLVTPEVQVQLLAIMGDAGACSIDDCIDALPGHPAPVSAVLALADAGILEIESGVLSGNTRVSRRLLADAHASDAGDFTARNAWNNRLRSILSAAAAESIQGSTVRCGSSYSKLEGRPFQPVVSIIEVKNLEFAQREKFWGSPHVYLALHGQNVSVGTNAEGHQRVRAEQFNEQARVVVIADQTGKLTTAQSRVAERIFALSIDNFEDYTLDNAIPDAPPCTVDEYEQLRLFASEALLLMRRAGVAFSEISARQILAGPRGPSEMLDFHNDALTGELFTLESDALSATAVEHLGTWVLQLGTEVKIPAVMSAGSLVRGSLHHEFIVSGFLEPAEEKFILTRPLAFPSAVAAAGFVNGSNESNLPWIRGIGAI